MNYATAIWDGVEIAPVVAHTSFLPNPGLTTCVELYNGWLITQDALV